MFIRSIFIAMAFITELRSIKEILTNHIANANKYNDYNNWKHGTMCACVIAYGYRRWPIGYSQPSSSVEVWVSEICSFRLCFINETTTKLPRKLFLYNGPTPNFISKIHQIQTFPHGNRISSRKFSIDERKFIFQNRKIEQLKRNTDSFLFFYFFLD